MRVIGDEWCKAESIAFASCIIMPHDSHVPLLILLLLPSLLTPHTHTHPLLLPTLFLLPSPSRGIGKYYYSCQRTTPNPRTCSILLYLTRVP